MGKRKRRARLRREIKADQMKKRFQKISKIALSVGSVAAGAYAMNNTEIGKRAVRNAFLPSLIEARKGFKRDMLGKNSRDLRNWREAFDRNFNKKNLNEMSKKLAANKKIKKKMSLTDGGKKFIDYAKLKKDIPEQFIKNAKNKDMEEFIDAYSKHKGYDKNQKKELRDFVHDLYDKVTDQNLKDQTVFDINAKKAKRMHGILPDQYEIVDAMNLYKQAVEVDKPTISQFDELVKDVEEKTIEAMNEKQRANYKTIFDQLIEKVTNTRSLTLGDLRDGSKDYRDYINLDEIHGYKKNKQGTGFDFVRTNIFDDIIKDSRFGDDIVIDKSIRIHNETGELLDFSYLTKFTKDKIKTAKGSLPGSILNKYFFDEEERSVALLSVGKKSITASLFDKTVEDNILQENQLLIGGRIYGLTEENGVTRIDPNKVSSGNFFIANGHRKEALKEILGSDKIHAEAYEGTIAQLLDINQNGKGNVILDIYRAANKMNDPNWERTVVERSKEFYNNPEQDVANRISDLERIVAQQFGVNNIYDIESKTATVLNQDNHLVSALMNRQLTSVSDELLVDIINNGDISDKQKDLLHILLNDSQEAVREFFDRAIDNEGNLTDKPFKNKELNSYVKQYFSQIKEADLDSVSIRETKNVPILGIPMDTKYERNEVGTLRMEMLKEIILDKDADKTFDFMKWADDTADISDQSKFLKNLSIKTLFDKDVKTVGKYADIDEISTITSEHSGVEHFGNRLYANDNFRNQYNEFMDEISKSSGAFNKIYKETYNENNLYSEYADVLVAKHITGLDIIQDINETIKNGGSAKDYLLDLGKDLFAGRNNRTSEINNTTLKLFYEASRLSKGVEAVGLGLSQDSSSSFLDMAGSIMLKRVLPIAAAIGTLDYLNDTSRKFFGQSMTGALAQGLADLDIGARRIIDKVPMLNTALNSFAESSVIHEYWFGDRHYQNADEREDWYENGYSPVRSSRFWGFGSSSEFRGGAINYWQPNYLRRLQSDYHNISVYGSSEEKWAHSYIPTPTHPFSTVRALLNPYWLEKKHLKENDRPYPMTGKLFSENTPWGVILNPTLGQILKPVRMLPQAKRRLGSNGIDVNAVLERINTRIKQRDNGKEMLIAEGSDIRNAEYVPYGNPEPDELNISISHGNVQVQGIDFMDKLTDFGDYETPDGTTYTQEQGTSGSDYQTGTKPREQVYINTEGHRVSSAAQTGRLATIVSQAYGKSEAEVGTVANDIIGMINSAIKSHSNKEQVAMRNEAANKNLIDKGQGVYIYHNLVNAQNNFTKDYYDTQGEAALLDKSLVKDFGRSARYSIRELRGIYGFISQQVNDTPTAYRYEGAGNMTSFTRGFWDSGIGGLGGEFMEIARRFFPHEDRDRVDINPLRNNMPDWIPDSYHFGDPFTQIPKGEARLPGKGYESLNELHTDRFGKYGAFDRYKILADIAPNSDEFKKWKAIAKETVTDPELQEQMKEISKRTARMSGNHEFYEYTYIKNHIKTEHGVINYVKDGKIILADGRELTLAGIDQRDYKNQEAINQAVETGKEITYKTYRTPVIDREGQSKTEAIIYVKGEDEPLNKKLIDEGTVEENVEDFTPLAALAKQTPTQEVLGAVQEVIAHAPIPIIHNKLLKTETAYESYMNETYYGTPLQTWDHPIKSFVAPAFNRQSGFSLAQEAISLAAASQYFDKIAGKEISKGAKIAGTLGFMMTNPAAAVTGNTWFLSHMNFGASGAGEKLSRWNKGAKIGVGIATAKYAWDNADNPVKSTAGMAMAGAFVAHHFEGWEALKDVHKIFKHMNVMKGAAIGAAVGFGLSAIKNPDFDKDKMFSKWAPKSTRKKWDLDEYFDRLTYIKYKGLYEDAARKARLLEHNNVEGIFKRMDRNKKKIAKLNRKAMKLAEKNEGNTSKYRTAMTEIDNRRRALEENNKVFFKGGRYTEAAVAYKKKMESTMYGMQETATTDEILAAVPDQYKDHFRAFMNVTDKHERRKILKSMPAIMRRPLQAAWGEKLSDVDSNEKFFGTHAMPKSSWKGWKPNVNLKHVKMKTIENEGMLLSDFGYYDSEKQSPSYIEAPTIRNYDRRNKGMIGRAARISLNMSGAGVAPYNVSVDRTRTPGLWVIADIKQTMQDIGKVASSPIASLQYGLTNSI